MKKVTFYIGLMWRPVLVSVFLLAILFVTFNFQLKSLTNGYTRQESIYVSSLTTAESTLSTMTYLPMRVAGFLTTKATDDRANARFVSAALGMISVIGMYFLLSKWHTRRVSMLTTFMYGSSVWMLITARNSMPNISLAISPWLIYLYLKIDQAKRKNFMLTVLVIALGVSLYLPGYMLAFIVLGIWQRKKISSLIKKTNNLYAFVLILGFLLVIAPLIYLSILHPKELALLIGKPIGGLTPKIYFNNLYDIIVGLSWNSTRIKQLAAGRIALLDLFSLTMLAAGIIIAIKKRKQDKMLFSAIALIVGILMCAIGGMISLAIVMPFVYILIAVGMTWLLQQWLSVFPRNPVAQNIGIGLVILVAVISIGFNYSRYFVAWPHMTTTVTIYNNKP